MTEPLSYKELEQLVKSLKEEKLELLKTLTTKEETINRLKKAAEFVNRFSDEGILVLEKESKEDMNELFNLKIIDLNSAGCRLIDRERNDILNKKLSDFLDSDLIFTFDDESITSDFGNGVEIFIKNLNKYYKFQIKPFSISQVVVKLTDITDYYKTKAQLNKNMQRDELFTEILNILNSEKNYDTKFNEILKLTAYHFKTKRIIIFNNSENKRSGVITHQFSMKDVPLLPENTFMQYKKRPSYNKMLIERKMILGYNLSYLPDDIREFFEQLKMNNAYIFPIFVEEDLFGSIVFENSVNSSWDTTDINYLKMVTVLISNLVSRHHYETKLLTSKNKAEEADRLKSSFLANMSHDIRIPMTAIIGFSDLLADPDLSVSEREEFIELISKSGQDLLTLVDNIVDVAKIETGQLKIQKDKYSLRNLFNEVYQQHSKNDKIIEQDDLELILDFPDKFNDLPFETDVFRFKQVLNNLVDNAIKFTETGSIHFGISNVLSDSIEFYVQDTGIGIAEETQDIIFERFSKIDRTYTKEYNGTGLGLAISKSLIELMNGEIRIVSYPGKGSTFYFTHPLPEEAKDFLAHNTETETDSQYDWKDKTILIAEDVEQNYKFLEFILHPTKANIIWAKNGIEAVGYFKEGEKIDCVLMDIRMPKMNGIEATKEILKIKQVPIIAQTAYTMGDEKELAMMAGCSDYISKPVHSKVMLKMIDKHISIKA